MGSGEIISSRGRLSPLPERRLIHEDKNGGKPLEDEKNNHEGSHYDPHKHPQGDGYHGSKSPPLNIPRPRQPRIRDVDPKRLVERERQARERERIEISKASSQGQSESKKVDPAEEYKRLMELRSGGRYVPPGKLRALQEQMSMSKSSKEFQRVKWDKLKKSINGLINKVNKSNLRDIVLLIFQQNIVRGRGLLVRSIMKAQSLSLSYTPVYASLIAVINSKLPQIGELLVKRLVIQFRRAYKRNDKRLCISSGVFLAHLVNQQVAHEILCLEIMYLLLLQPTDDSVEIAVGFVKEVGLFLSENSQSAFNGVFERFRAILREATLDKRTQYMVETLFQIRKDEFKDNPIIPDGLDLVEEEDQIIHMVGVDDDLKSEDILNVFRFDENYEETEAQYNDIKKEILGDSEDDEGSSSDAESGSEEDEEGEQEEAEINDNYDNEVLPVNKADMSRARDDTVIVEDMTNSQLVNLRRTIYLTVMSTMSIDEICHKITRIKVPIGHEIEVVNMLVECCSQEKSYNKVYGGVGARLCRLSREWHMEFRKAFEHYYEIIHRYETSKLRNIATMFGYLLASDSLSWEVFEVVHMTESESTSSSRIFIKLLFQEMRQELGITELVKRFADPYLLPFLENMMPMGDNLAATRFSINYFTAIGLGALTEGMREHLKNRPPSPSSPRDSFTGSDTGSYSRSPSRDSREGSFYSRSPSRDSRGRSYSRSPVRNTRSKNYSRSPVRDSRDRSYSRSPIRNSRDRSYSRSPVRNSRGRSYSKSPIRDSRDGSYSRSPVRGRSYSRSPFRDSKLPIRNSRGRSYSRSPVRDSRYRGYSKSPPRGSSRSPVNNSERRIHPRSVSRSLSPEPRKHHVLKETKSPKNDSYGKIYSRSPDNYLRHSKGKRGSSISPSQNSYKRSRPRSKSPQRDYYSRTPSPDYRKNDGGDDPNKLNQRRFPSPSTREPTISKSSRNNLPEYHKKREGSTNPNDEDLRAKRRVRASDYL